MGKDLEGTGYDIVEKVSRNFPGGAKENHENTLGQPIPSANSNRVFSRYGSGGLAQHQPSQNPNVPA
jgi:hypothetical protein